MSPLRILPFAIFAIPLWTFDVAHSRPFLYISSFTYGGSAKQCLEGAKTALQRNGFTLNLSIQYYNNQSMGGSVSGSLPDAPVVAEIDCDKSIGVSAVAVSGLDNEVTYQKYTELYKEKW
ncbi:hypothetical protein KBZ18_10290 [Synechococcus sp. Cruz-9H2]|uniref:hypothetical protein n=1 Tax=unclassified Synechococcus TaxID=2626047 RepID=UPI0020CD11EC|nr:MULTISPECIES: hypothetical protein [unclassified Synechococcus]MCP9819882.1 hypothetical protein [Synechococcus sp. Cruz-9H2]MCP9844052.1 hypothetical protein [Synechococcus sp. Edmonson 11F2]MCP9856312.1 hypothetical protein [Synechococcus sp. Cruz-9C9]MCP9863597.1 hypothetical protein [Synechococcus sp. Cruz-7E5]MCP9870793.1 hypothetical protein [Synechococcus sp. Cruz-7B9]